MHVFQVASALAVLALAASFSSVATAVEKPARLKDGKGAPTSTMMAAYYDRQTGICTEGSLQLISKDRLRALKAAWDESVPQADCDGPTKKSTPRRAAYPQGADGNRMAGAAHVLVQLETDGSIALAEPVCATDEAFAKAALETVRTMSFTPRICEGRPVRNSILLPFAYNP